MSATKVSSASGIDVRINGIEYGLDQIELSWLHQQIDARRRAGETVCVVVTAHSDGANITLATPDCASGGGGTRPPNRLESEIFERWNELVTGKRDFTAGNVWAFLRYLERVV